MAGCTACRIEVTNKVYPSGAARATNDVAIFPFAPALLSTIIVWPNNGPIDSASIRAVLSAVPPGENPTTKVMGLSGSAADTTLLVRASEIATNAFFQIGRASCRDRVCTYG